MSSGDTSVRALIAKAHADGKWHGPPSYGNSAVLFNAESSGRLYATHGETVREHIIGFAELPVNTVINTHTDFDGFMHAVDTKARYYFVKPDYEDGVDVDDFDFGGDNE